MTLVSVITPTWKRHNLLVERCIPSVKAQTWAEVEHVVVSDGPDSALQRYLNPMAGDDFAYIALDRHDDSPHNYGSAARNRGLLLALGDYISYLDDDNAYRPGHVEELATALDLHPEIDFVYSKLETHPGGQVIGSAPPDYGCIDTSVIMHRRELIERFGPWPLAGQVDCHDQHAPDWGLVSRWVGNGATWMHVPLVTVDYWSRQ